MAEVKILIEFEGLGEVEAVLFDSISPGTYEALLKNLPLESRANVWGKEVYFDVGASHPIENGREELEVGDVAYWPPGRALCLFFGPTPKSKGERPVADSPVNVVGRISKNLELLPKVKRGVRVKVKLA